LTVVDIALDELAPLHVVKEEGLLFFRIVQVAKGHRPADVEAENIEPKFGYRRRRWVKESAGVESVIAVELPCRQKWPTWHSHSLFILNEVEK